MGSVIDLTSGGLAGMFSKTVVFPLDVVRKRMQIQGPSRMDYIIYKVPVYSTAVLTCMKEIVRREGLLGLYKGLTPAVVKAACASAVTFFMYGPPMPHRDKVHR